ncbi:MAG: hypothetical protein HYX53_06345 [Chloroflexi bacterium]|nr:hypothetical protein [Chloroflexota bacterium]
MLVIAALGAVVLSDAGKDGAATVRDPRADAGGAIPGLSIYVSPGASLTDTFVTLAPDADPPRIELRNKQSGALMASVRTSFAPLVLARPAANQLLVADFVRDEDRDPPEKSRLLVLNLEGDLAVSQIVELPARAGYAVYYPGMLLSADERYLYYYALENRDALPFCSNGGDAQVCDRVSVRTVDLDHPELPPVAVTLDQGCGTISMAQAGASGAWVACGSSSTVSLVSPSGRILRIVDFDIQLSSDQDSEFGHNVPRIVNVFSSGALVGVLVEDGTYRVSSVDGTIVSYAVVPRGFVLARRGQAQEVDSRTALLSIVEPGGRSSNGISGVVRFDLVTGEIIEVVDVTAVSVVQAGDQYWIIRASGVDRASVADPSAEVSLTGQTEAQVIIP